MVLFDLVLFFFFDEKRMEKMEVTEQSVSRQVEGGEEQRVVGFGSGEWEKVGSKQKKKKKKRELGEVLPPSPPLPRSGCFSPTRKLDNPRFVFPPHFLLSFFFSFH